MTDEHRRQQIIRLLQTRDQHLPGLRRRELQPRGFVHDTLAPQVCPTCDGVDSRGCTGCGGRGSVEVRRTRDPYAVEKTAPYGLTGERHEAARDRDRQLDRLERQLAPPRSAADLLADANVRPDGWELERRRMWQRYDYRALDVALDALGERAPACYHVVHSVWVYSYVTPGPAMAAVAEAGIAFLSARLPQRLRAPDDPVRVENRDQRIRRRVLTDGAAVREVAVTEGLSVSQVNRIVKEAKAA